MRDLLPLLPRPSRFAGIEDGACRKDPARVRLRMALAFPDTYEVGMSYLGQKILYGIVNAHEAWWAERAMAPDREAGAVLRANNAPLCTLESDTPLARLHCVSFPSRMSSAIPMCSTCWIWRAFPCAPRNAART